MYFDGRLLQALKTNDRWKLGVGSACFRTADAGHDYCSLVDSRCRDFIHCSKAASL